MASHSTCVEQRRQHHCDLVRRGFQTIQRSVESSTEGGAASLTAKRLDPLDMTMLAIADQGVELCICVAKILALRVGTGEAFSVDPFGRSPPTFDLAPGTHRCSR